MSGHEIVETKIKKSYIPKKLKVHVLSDKVTV